MRGRVHIGPAGWSYKDWDGVVYPKGALSDPLSYLMKFFDTIEINSTFYRPPSMDVSTRWAKKASSHEGFQFTAKLFRMFTHEPPSAWSVADIDRVREGMAPLFEANVLAAVLVQFPSFFKAERRNVDHLKRLRDTFADWPLVLEVRHVSWLRPDSWRLIELMRYAICNIDQPTSQNGIAPGDLATVEPAYFRMHGRNSLAWFSRKASRDEKYDYLYDETELDHIVQLINSLREKKRQTWVVTNNHFAGKAVVNALELSARLGIKTLSVPELLLEQYPRLKSIVAP